MLSTSLLSQGDGYGILIGFGTLFALGMVATTLSLQRYQVKHFQQLIDKFEQV